MSDYEQKAWRDIEDWRRKQLERPDRLPAPLRQARERAVGAGRRAWESVPANDAILSALHAGMAGLQDFVTDAAISSLRRGQILESYRRAGQPVEELSEIRKLDLQDIDRVMPNLGLGYATALLTEGAAAGFASGGGTMLATGVVVTSAGAAAVPGAAVLVAVMLGDVAAVLGATSRASAHYATYYGYDVWQPSERAYLLGTLSVAAVSGQGGKQAAFAQLHKLVGLLARDATWKRLNQEAFVKLVKQLFAALGERLVKRKLGQMVPLAGVAIGGGINYRYSRSVSDNAYWLWRERFLMDKYGLHDAEADVEVIDIRIIPDDEEPGHPALGGGEK